MNIDDARVILWPFDWPYRECKGQKIGDLFNDGVLVDSDLLEAQKLSRWPRVTMACRTLLQYTLSKQQSQSLSESGGVNVFSSHRRSFSERRQIQYAMLQGLVVGFVLALGVIFMLNVIANNGARGDDYVSPLASLTTVQQILVWIIVLGVFFLFVTIPNWIIDQFDNVISVYRKGQLGEERILNTLYQVLDGNWWLFRNLELPGQKNGDIDFVLVSSKGIWVLEVKSYGREYRNTGDKWEVRYGKTWIQSFKNPSRQAKRQAAALSHILKTHHIKQWVEPVVVWANPESKLIVKNPSISIWELPELGRQVKQLGSNRLMSDEQLNTITKILKELYQDQFADM